MATIGFVLHGRRDTAVRLAQEAVGWLVSSGHRPRVLAGDAEAAGLAAWACEADDFAAGADLAVSLGGDGTMLRTVHLVVAAGVPVLGVNLGRLNYLSYVEPAGLRPALERFLTGDYGLERRMTLAVDVDSPSGAVPSGRHMGFNEVVAEKPCSGRTVHLSVDVNGEFFTSYAADGLIVATPTGSTAYALSARGPIISPLHRAILMTPVAPHMLFDRSLVLGADESVRIEVIDDRPAALTVDGTELGVLAKGDSVTCRGGTRDATLVSLGPRDFHRVLKAKFGLADR